MGSHWGSISLGIHWLSSDNGQCFGWSAPVIVYSPINNLRCENGVGVERQVLIYLQKEDEYFKKLIKKRKMTDSGFPDCISADAFSLAWTIYLHATKRDWLLGRTETRTLPIAKSCPLHNNHAFICKCLFID